jgi:small conductance mechanosensitive channel
MLQSLLDKLIHQATEYSGRFVGALLILLLGLWVAKALRKVLAKVLARTQLESTFVGFCLSGSKVVMTVVVVLAALNSLGVPLTSLLAVLGTAGLAVALALKDSLNHVAAGISLLVLQPFKVNDYVEIGGVQGTVVGLNFFHTSMNTADNRRILMPNAKLLSDTIINYSKNPVRRIDLLIGVAYGSDLRQAQAALSAVLSEDERVLVDPAPVVMVADLADSSVNFHVRPWVKTEDFFAVRGDLLMTIKQRLDAEGIEIPFPQRDIHVHEVKAALSPASGGVAD